jgi:hypothetical protein
MVPAARHLCGQSRPPNQESGPNSSLQGRGPFLKDSHPCRRVLLSERPRKLIPSNRYGLFSQIAGSTRHSRLRVPDSGGSAGTNFCRFGVPRELYSDQGLIIIIIRGGGFRHALRPVICPLCVPPLMSTVAIPYRYWCLLSALFS